MNRDLSNKRFGRLVAIRVTKTVRRNKYWLCFCDCGEQKEIREGHLLSGNTKSCGCLNRELSKERIIRASTVHGESHTRLYRIWRDMKTRCSCSSTSSFKNYGERGIRVNSVWESSYAVFRDWALKNGYAENLTIDRVNPNGNYEPSNCRWITIQEQQKNRRNNVHVIFEGEEMILADAARKSDVPYSILRKQLSN